MVMIPLKQETWPAEWVILELQGDIDCFDRNLQGQICNIGSLQQSCLVRADIEPSCGLNVTFPK